MRIPISELTYALCIIAFARKKRIIPLDEFPLLCVVQDAQRKVFTYLTEIQ